MTFGIAYLLLGIAWIVASLFGGAMLAMLARRMHPSLSFRKLWVFYSCLLGIGAALLFLIGIL